MNFKKFRKFMVTAAILFAATSQSHAGTIYTINYDGANIDVSGTLETDGSVGTFTATVFDTKLLNYSILASWNGAAPFTFTKANSTWGDINGTNVNIMVSPTIISLEASPGGVLDTENIFLIADNETNGALENLKLGQTDFGYRTPTPPDELIFDTVSAQFSFATQQVTVPEPLNVLLIACGIFGFGFKRLRKPVFNAAKFPPILVA